MKWPGDVDGDGRIRLPDLICLAQTWYSDAKTSPSRYDYNCDFDMDGQIKIGDLIIMGRGWYIDLPRQSQ